MDSIRKIKRNSAVNVVKFTNILEKCLDSHTLTHKDICEINNQGLYIIFDEKQILYVGKTNRSGKIRMRELATDFRSHTFNKKLLSKRFKDIGFVFDILKTETKKEWIANGSTTDVDFKKNQSAVNDYIKKLDFKFYEEKDERILIALEHFSIAVLNPIYND